MKTPDRYPLAWPAHRPRRLPRDRARGSFEAGGKRITASAAADRLEEQIEKLGGRYPVLSTNLELKMDGRPRADRAPPADPGACVYFALKGRPMAMACDAYTTVEMNIAAIANHIDAVRRQARYGVASAEESLQAFSALPPPTAGGRAWRDVFGFDRLFPGELSAAEAKALVGLRHKSRLQAAHPDKGGTDAEAAELNAAKDAAFAELDAQ